MKKLLFILLMISITYVSKAQNLTDSIKAATTLEEIFTVCNSSEPEDGSDNHQMIFERLAPYILSMSNDEHRNKKTASDYNIAYERKIVDQLGIMIKKWLENYDSYKILSYSTQTKQNGESWCALDISFKKGEHHEKVIFAFIKLGDSLLLGDID